eukprot:TRINITY_DN16412_c0_g1_i1.p1 TRINITY_DN16412_c0_g1~~TRINITY_DN16412_c0_g1_i1.p1  ORF type:complete len:531 (-),score=74.64 TRINITY_DN16412_c0_g1_i1:91-1683(-)
MDIAVSTQSLTIAGVASLASLEKWRWRLDVSAAASAQGSTFLAFGMDFEERLHKRALWASLGSAGLTSVAAIPATFFFERGGTWTSIVTGAFLLGVGNLLRAAALLQRTAGFRQPSLRRTALSILAIVTTAWACVCFVKCFEFEDTRSLTFGGLVGLAAFQHLADRRVLEWRPTPREAAHRRFKSGFVAVVMRAFRWSVFCTVGAACVDVSSMRFLLAVARARLTAGILVFLAVEFHTEAVQNGSNFVVSDMPNAAAVAKALSQPLSAVGPGLGRWAATAWLSQAVAHTEQGVFPGVRAGTGMGGDAAAMTFSMPPLAKVMFGRGGADWITQASSTLSSLNSGSRSAGGGSGRCQPGGGGGGRDAVGGGRGGLFAVYLASGLEVLREFTVRVQCLVQASRCRGPDCLHSTHISALDAQVVELLPLARVAAAGLSGWISVSRDLDDSGVVQREAALQKVLYELCGVLCATEDLWPMRCIMQLSGKCVEAVHCAREEARHGLEQLLVAFEGAGLRQIEMPPLYARLIASLCY